MDFLKEVIYPLDEPARTRTKPMQVLCVGPARSGTTSLRTALTQLGYCGVYHGFEVVLNPADDKAWGQLYRKKWRGFNQQSPGNIKLTAADFDQVIGHCVAITDLPAAVFARDLIEAYPDAKVILNTRRNVDAWYTSVMSTVVPLKENKRNWIRSWFNAELFWEQESFWRGIWPTFWRGKFEDNAKWVLKEHCAMVRGLVPPARLLEWDVSDGWEPLCKFLGKDVPETSFPRSNDKNEYDSKIAAYYKARNTDADKRIALIIMGSIFMIAVALIALRT